MSLSLDHICEFGHHQRDTFGSSAGGGGLRGIPNCSRSLQFMATVKGTVDCSFGLAMLRLVKLARVNQRGPGFICKVSPCSPSTRQVKLYLIKMLCSLPNSSPPHMVPLICVLWVGSDFHAAQSVPLEKREHMGHIFTCCLV